MSDRDKMEAFSQLRTVKATEPIQADDSRTLGQTSQLLPVPPEYVGKKPIELRGNQQFYRNKNAFTLFELLFTVAILAGSALVAAVLFHFVAKYW